MRSGLEAMTTGLEARRPIPAGRRREEQVSAAPHRIAGQGKIGNRKAYDELS